jgi:hypothetical protein
MNPHKLIFDYLDGELSREDDKALRELLREDTSLSRDYQSILDVHYEIEKSNKDFIYPGEFLDNVEEMILGRLDIDNAARKEKERRRKVFIGYSIASIPAFIVLFILSSINFGNLMQTLNIGNSNTDETNGQTAVIEQFTSDENSGNNQQFSEEKSFAKSNSSLNSKNDKLIISSVTSSEKITENASSMNLVTNEQIRTKNAAAVLSNLNETTEKNVLTETNTLDSDQRNFGNQIIEESVQPDKSKSNSVAPNNQSMQYYSQLPEGKSNVAQMNQKNTGFGGSFNTPSNTEFNQFGSIADKSDVELNSFFGKEFAAYGVNNNQQIINSFTQSIGAKIDDYSRVGIETGFMQITGDESTYIMINKSSKSRLGKIVLDNSDEKDILVKTKGIQSSDRKMFWFGLFYERNLLQLDKLSCSSRLSLGSSDVGFVSSLKVIGRYQLFSNFDLTLGADAKLFNGTQEFFVSKNPVSSTLSLIYGIRFSF